MAEREDLVLKEQIKTQMSNAMLDLNTAVRDFVPASQNIITLVESTETTRSQLSEIESYANGAPGANVKLVESFGNIDSEVLNMKGKISEYNDELATLASLYLGVQETIVTLLNATDAAFADADKRDDLLKILKSGNLDELFMQCNDTIAKQLKDAGYDGIEAAAGTSVKYLFAKVFTSIFNNTLLKEGSKAAVNAAGAKLMEALLSGSGDLSSFSISAVKAIFKVSIKEGIKKFAANKSATNTFFQNLFDDMGKNTLGTRANLAVNGTAGFIVNFAANVITSLARDGKVSWATFEEGASSAALTTVVSTIVSAAVKNVLTDTLIAAATEGTVLGSVVGPEGAVAAAITAVVTTLVIEGAKWVAGKIDSFLFDAPKHFDSLSNDEIIKIMEQQGYCFSVPKVGDSSVFDVMTELSKHGAPDELLTLVAVSSGLNVSVDEIKADKKSKSICGAINAFFCGAELSALEASGADAETIEAFKKLKELFELNPDNKELQDLYSSFSGGKMWNLWEKIDEIKAGNKDN